LETNKNPFFGDDFAKDLIMQGLSFRLAPYEGGKGNDEKQYTITLKERPSYKEPEPPKEDEPPKEPTPRERDAATSPTSGPGKFVNHLY
jgi:hypothetical protein